jgi:hypothetical protein
MSSSPTPPSPLKFCPSPAPEDRIADILSAYFGDTDSLPATPLRDFLQKELRREPADQVFPSLLELLRTGKLGEAAFTLNRLSSNGIPLEPEQLRELRKALADAHASKTITLEQYLAFELPVGADSASPSPCLFK